jgi:WhiB family redox-sensing transcriptional regulator
MALGEKLTPEAKAALLARLEAKYADAAPEPDLRRWRTPDLEDDDDPPPGARGLDTLRRFFELLEAERPAWQRDALCQEYPDVTFFPERGEPTEPAKAVCARCACQEECRAWAVTIDAPAGIWAGESARKLKQARAAA